MNEDVHLKLLIPCVAAGAIIGKGGEALEKIKRQTGARLKMSKANDFYPGTTERVCVIMGTIQACMQLNDYIMRKVSERPELIPSGMLPVSARERHNQVKILVPNTTAGIIIGKSGSFIKRIKEQSGALVQISQRSKELRLLERCIVITGDLEERRVAVSMILSKIAEDPHSASCPNCSYAHMHVHGAFASTQPVPPPPYTTDTTTVTMAMNGVGGQVRSHPSTNTVSSSFDPYGTGPNPGKEHLAMYRDSSALQSSPMPPIFFSFPPQDIAPLAPPPPAPPPPPPPPPPTFSVLPPSAYPDFTQVVFSAPGRHAVQASHLLNTAGNFLGPPASYGLQPTLLPPGPVCRTKLIPVGGAAEQAGTFGWIPQVQTTSTFSSVRFSPMSADAFVDAAANSVVLMNDQTSASLANALRFVPNYGLRCETRQFAYPQNHMPESAALLRPTIESFPAGLNLTKSYMPYTRSGQEMLIQAANLTECGRPADSAEYVGTTTTTSTSTTVEPELAMTAHTRYCSGESTDSALTASLTSLRLHPSLDDHPSAEVTHCSSPKSESQPTAQSPESINSNGTLSRSNPDPAGQWLNPDTDFRMVEYSYMVPQNPLYGTGRILSSSVLAPFQGAVWFNQALPSSRATTHMASSSGLLGNRVPCPTATDFVTNPDVYGLIPNRPAHHCQPSAEAVQFRYSTTPATSLVLTPTGGSYSQAHVLGLSQADRELPFDSSGANDPATGSGLLLVGTLQQVQHALAVLHMRTGLSGLARSMVAASTASGSPSSSTASSSPSSTSSSSAAAAAHSASYTTTSFTLDSPLRVDRIQPLSLPITWQVSTTTSPSSPSSCGSRPVHSLSEPVPNVR